MLQITIPATEKWDESKEEFIYSKEYTIKLEHSLVSLSKWESKWCKPFLSDNELTEEETLDYIRCMNMTQNIPPEAFYNITEEDVKRVADYINASMTATWFSEDSKGKRSREVVTSEIIDYWMIALQIPSEYRKWHLNKLLTLIRVCNIKNSPPKKTSWRESVSQTAKLNAARRKKFNTKG